MITLSKSSRKGKKWQVVLPDGKTVHFGAEGYLDYTQHHDKERRNRYIERHKATGKEQWDNPNTAGFFSKNLLWNLPSLEASIRDTEKKFGLKIILKK